MRSFNYIDLFAGAGGLSEGFIRQGFKPIAHVEMIKAACETLKTRVAYHHKSINLTLNIMEAKTIKETIEHLKQTQLKYANAIQTNVIERFCQIIEVGALTIGTDENGKIILQNTTYPEQFSKETVHEILKLNYINTFGQKVEPIVYGRNEWYHSRLKMINESLELFEIQLKTI